MSRGVGNISREGLKVHTGDARSFGGIGLWVFGFRVYGLGLELEVRIQESGAKQSGFM